MIDELETRTGKRISAPLDKVVDGFDPEKDLTLAEASQLLNTLTLVTEDREAQTTAEDFFNFAMIYLQDLAGRDDEAREQVEAAVTNLAMGMACLVNEVACDAIGKEQKRMANLAQFKHKRAESEAVKQAKIEWGKDAEQELRIGQCSKIVANHLDRSGYGRYADNKVRDWIRCCAPEYATRGGRTKKK